jgi:small subunit ribosomal protein S1
MSEEQIVNPVNAEPQEQATNGNGHAAATTKAPVSTQFDTAHDDFDWSIDKRNVSTYPRDERARYDGVYDGTFKVINDGEMITGNVVGMTKTDVVINIGFKSDGLVSLNEFRDLTNLKIGDDVEVMVVEKEDREGHLHLSRSWTCTARAKSSRA